MRFKDFQFNRSNLEKPLLILVLLAGFVLRFSGISWGLPYLYHSDEFLIVDVYLRMVQNLDLNPHWFIYPSFMMYVNAFSYGVYFLIRHLLENFTRLDITFPYRIIRGVGIIADPNVYLLGRFLSILFGTGVVLLSYLCTKKITGKTSAGLIAAVFTAISNANVVQSRLILPNIYPTFWVIATLWFSLMIFSKGKPRHYILAGLSAGFAITSKYNGVVAVVMLLSAHLLQSGIKKDKLSFLFLGLASIAAGFLISMPYAIFDWQTFFTMMLKARQDYATGWPGQEGDVIQWYIVYLEKHEGLVVLAAISGIVFAFLKRNKIILIPAIFSVIYFAFISSFQIRNEQTILPLIPILHILGGTAISLLLVHFQTTLQNPRVRLAFLGLALLAILIPLMQTIPRAVSVILPDSRETSRLWINENIPPGSVIALEAFSPYIDPNIYQVLPTNQWMPLSIQMYKDLSVDYLVFSEDMFGRYYKNPKLYHRNILVYEELFKQLEPVKIFNDGGYEVRIYHMPDQTK